MTDTLIRDHQTLQAALAKANGEEVSVSLSRETAELVAKLLDARNHGRNFILVGEDDEVSPADAAPLLGMSRPQVRKLMDEGLLEHRKVGTHHRVKVASIHQFIEVERARQGTALERLSALQDRLGLTE